MSGRFKRTDETEVIRRESQVINNKFFKAASVQEDPYAALEREAAARRAAIARETMGYSEELEASQPHAWEQNRTASVYEVRRLNPADEELSNLSPADVDPRAVRRAGYGIDDYAMTGRPNPAENFEFLDPITATLRGNSIWSGDAALIEAQLEEEFMKLAEADNQRFERRSADEKKKALHSTWEGEKMRELKPSARVASRGHNIVRTHMENVAAGKFGVLDASYLDQRERERIEMITSRAERKAAIKDKHMMSREAKKSQWEKEAEMKSRAQRLQDEYRNEWAAEMLRQAQGE